MARSQKQTLRHDGELDELLELPLGEHARDMIDRAQGPQHVPARAAQRNARIEADVGRACHSASTKETRAIGTRSSWVTRRVTASIPSSGPVSSTPYERRSSSLAPSPNRSHRDGSPRDVDAGLCARRDEARRGKEGSP